MALTDNLVAYWKFEGNSNDSVGSNNGTDTSITYATDYGKINQGVKLDATTDKIALTSNFGIGTGNFTFAFWVNPTSIVNHSRYFAGYGPSSIDFRIMQYPNGSAAVRFLHYNGSTEIVADLKTTEISTGTWYFVCGVKNGDNLLLYLNGSYVRTGTGWSSRSIDATTAIGFGYVVNNAAYSYIDEFGVWSRALTAAEVITLYNNGNGLYYDGVKSRNGLAIGSINKINGLV